MISTGTIRAVNPVSLAHASSVTKIPRFAAPVTPVIRPNLLTTQLMGCCPICAGGDQAGPVGLSGFVPPDYGSLRDGGTYGLFKMASSGHGLGKGASGTNAASYNNRSWSFGLRGLGKGASGTNAASYDTRSWSFGLRGLGQALTTTFPNGNISVLGTVQSGGTTLPGVGNVDPTVQSTLTNLANSIKAGIGAGRTEANLIVPAQNNLMAQLGTVTNQFLTGSSPSLTTLQQLYTQVWMLGVGFQEFVLQRVFTDRRASGQALNTIMPYIDGSCGYSVPLGATATPSSQNCIHWGSGSIGGDGTNGMLGALSRAIVNGGGTAPVLMDLHQAANSGIPPSAAAAMNVATGQQASIFGTTGIPSTIGGIPTALLVGGLVLLLALRK